MSSQTAPKSTKPVAPASGLLRTLLFLLLVVALTSAVVLFVLSRMPQVLTQLGGASAQTESGQTTITEDLSNTNASSAEDTASTTAEDTASTTSDNNVSTAADGVTLTIAYGEVSYREAVTFSPGMDIPALIDQYPPGTVFLFRSGEYRGVSIAPRDGDVFVGEPNTILNGSKLIEASAFRQEGNVWVLDGQTQRDWRHGNCLDSAPRCNYAYTLYFNNQFLPEANSVVEVGAGTWFFDYDNDRVYLGSDPNGQRVELSDVDTVFSSTAADVVIRNFIIEKYAAPAQHPTLGGRETLNWRIENNIIRLNGGQGINAGSGMKIIGNTIVYNGQMGILASGDDVLVENNEIAYNNTKGYQSKWEAGGAKFVRTNRLIARNNYVHNNGGPGLWTDIDARTTLYEGNLVVSNETMGIFHEISYDAIIRNNIVKFNAPSYREWLYGAQIQISNSTGAEVYNNEVVSALGGGHGIMIIEQNRTSDTDETLEYFSRDNRVYNNTIVHMDTDGLTGAGTDVSERADAFYNEAGNTFENNTYYVANPASTYWYWGGEFDWDGFRSSGHEAEGSLTGEVPIEAALVPRWPLTE